MLLRIICFPDSRGSCKRGSVKQLNTAGQQLRIQNKFDHKLSQPLHDVQTRYELYQRKGHSPCPSLRGKWSELDFKGDLHKKPLTSKQCTLKVASILSKALWLGLSTPCKSTFCAHSKIHIIIHCSHASSSSPSSSLSSPFANSRSLFLSSSFFNFFALLKTPFVPCPQAAQLGSFLYLCSAQFSQK